MPTPTSKAMVNGVYQDGDNLWNVISIYVDNFAIRNLFKHYPFMHDDSINSVVVVGKAEHKYKLE
jgi:hypothetical protein